MPITLMKTDNGPHSAADWAVTTSKHLIEIAEQADPAKAAAARKLEGEFISLLETAHSKVQSDGRAHYGKHGADVLMMHPKITSANVTFKAILEAAAKSPFAEHFAKQETQDYIKAVLHKHYLTSLEIERQWHTIRKQ